MSEHFNGYQGYKALDGCIPGDFERCYRRAGIALSPELPQVVEATLKNLSPEVATGVNLSDLVTYTVDYLAERQTYDVFNPDLLGGWIARRINNPRDG